MRRLVNWPGMPAGKMHQREKGNLHSCLTNSRMWAVFRTEHESCPSVVTEDGCRCVDWLFVQYSTVPPSITLPLGLAPTLFNYWSPYSSTATTTVWSFFFYLTLAAAAECTANTWWSWLSIAHFSFSSSSSSSSSFLRGITTLFTLAYDVQVSTVGPYAW